MPISKANAARYPANWKEISHRIRFVRAEGRCECQGECGDDHGGRCEARHGHAHPVTGSLVVLTCAHRNHVPEECEDSNLFAACARCHLKYDRHHHAANAKRTNDAKRQAVLEKAGQLAFAVECGLL